MLEAIALRLEAIALRLEAIASRLEAQDVLRFTQRCSAHTVSRLCLGCLGLRS